MDQACIGSPAIRVAPQSAGALDDEPTISNAGVVDESSGLHIGIPLGRNRFLKSIVAAYLVL